MFEQVTKLHFCTLFNTKNTQFNLEIKIFNICQAYALIQSTKLSKISSTNGMFTGR